MKLKFHGCAFLLQHKHTHTQNQRNWFKSNIIFLQVMISWFMKYWKNNIKATYQSCFQFGKTIPHLRFHIYLNFSVNLYFLYKMPTSCNDQLCYGKSLKQAAKYISAFHFFSHTLSIKLKYLTNFLM